MKRKGKEANPGIDTYPCTRCDTPVRIDRTKCPSCGQFNIAEKVKDRDNDTTVLLSDVDETVYPRLITGPWDACFGGGIVTTSVTLLGGAPGAGKSTMSLQVTDSIAESTRREVVYVGAEEAVKDIKSRAVRLKIRNLNLIRCIPMGSHVDVGEVLMHRKPSAIILDSLPGLVGDDAAAAVSLCQTLKTFSVLLNAPVIVIDHVTKQDDFAGLMKLQHAVDTTMTLFPIEGSESWRELTTVKNRFGKSHVSVEFDMTEFGLIPILGLADDEEEEEDE